MASPRRATVPHKDIRRNDRPDATEVDFLKGRYFAAACPATITTRDLVRITGPAILGVRQVDLVDPTDYAKMPAIGMVIEKPEPTKCVVQILGEINGGLMAGLVPNGRYFVGLDGRITFPPPVPLPGGYAFMQLIGVALGSTILLINPHYQMTKLVG